MTTNKNTFNRTQLVYFPIKFDKVGAAIFVQMIPNTDIAICVNIESNHPFKIHIDELFATRRDAHLYSVIKNNALNLYVGQGNEVFCCNYRVAYGDEFMFKKQLQIMWKGKYYSSDAFNLSRFECDRSKFKIGKYCSTVNTTIQVDAGFNQPSHVFQVRVKDIIFDNFMN